MLYSLSPRERILLRTHVNNSGCWMWQGTLFANSGYAQITYDKHTYLGHRLVMHLFHNFDLASKDLVLHHCDVKGCINPDHLYVGDRNANARDAVARGRQLSGVRHPNAKLTEAHVREIRKLIAQGDLKYGAMAKSYGIDASLVGLIKRRKVWKDVRD